MKPFSHYLSLYMLFMFITGLAVFTTLGVMGIGNPVPDPYVIPTLLIIVVAPALYTLLWEWLFRHRPRL